MTMEHLVGEFKRFMNIMLTKVMAVSSTCSLHLTAAKLIKICHENRLKQFYHYLYHLSNFSTKYLMMCKLYTDVGGIK